MATVAELQTKVMAAAEKVEKIKGTIAKHEAAAAKKLTGLERAIPGVTFETMKEHKYRDGSGSEHYWAICEIEGKLEDAKGAKRRLRDAEEVLKNWQAKIDKETEKDRFLNDDVPAAIKEFLERWKAEVKQYCIDEFPKYIQDKNDWQAANENAKAEFVRQFPTAATWGAQCKEFVKQYLKDNKIKPKHTMYPPLVRAMDTYRDEAERLEWLEKTLEADKKAKMLDLINRVNEVVGAITDARGLRVSEKGTLDGLIVGEKGKARIETNGVAGHNIVCFHYRTNVWPIR
jgi:hypothetical protein